LTGRLPTVLCLHESGATGRIWDNLGRALEGHAVVVAPDRPGWGETEAPEGYERTTITEQAAFAASRLPATDRPVVVCGAGIGAVAALELSLGEPDLVLGTVLIEPPLLSFLPEATEQLSEDVALVREIVAQGGREAALDAYVAGKFPGLGAGAGRIPPEHAQHGARAARALFAELSAVPAWERSDSDLASASRPAVVVVAADSPQFLRRSAEALSSVLARSDLRETEAGLPHADRAGELAALVLEVAETR
jgi:pimeloyl-ACP methyl ester carboxylesterase